MKKRPNILFIHCDSMDGRAMGCMGHPAMAHATPTLDALARRGARFANTYTNNPICCPSRASMWSGQFTHHCEAWNNHKGLEQGTPTFRTELERAGYHTRSFGKEDYRSGQHSLRARVSPWTRAANHARPAYCPQPPRIMETAQTRVHTRDWEDVDGCIAWLRHKTAGSDDRPFWLYLGIRAPHPPFDISRHYLDLIDDTALAVPPRDEYDHPVLQYQRRHKNQTGSLPDEAILKIRHVYLAMIAEVDAMVGGVMEALDELALADNTYVVFSSDHGELAMEHGQTKKMSFYEPSARVPLILCGPGVQGGRAVDRLASLVDIYPTLMDMAGIKAPDNLDGHSLLPEATGRPGTRPDWVLSEFHGTSVNTGSFMWRSGDWKYIHFVGYEPLLFNLKEDPNEIHNAAPARPEVVAALNAQLHAVVDAEAVDTRVKAYDRRCFRQWRAAELAAGTYRTTMARLFSGNDAVLDRDKPPWTDEDEQQILDWLEG